MLPVGYLMIEHRLIDRMIALMKIETQNIKKENRSDPVFVGQAIDFLKVYADACHHGKEEDIYFKKLLTKKLTVEHEKMMQELLHEHAISRKTVKSLENAWQKGRATDKSALVDMACFLGELTILYPNHVAKEDKQFFLPSMEYLTEGEQNAMLKEFHEFDRKILHNKYELLIDRCEQKVSLHEK
jgi:hemerythrin-like domain-containing protein